MSETINRFIIIVLDSVGVGELPDAGLYGDEGCNTLGHIFAAMGASYALPNLAGLGLYNILGRSGAQAKLNGSFGKMACASPAKDTTAGHWELAGLVLEKAFPVYPNGFPAEVIGEFEKLAGTKSLGNIAASGTEIIKRLGDEHCRTGFPIVYTSADSVFQIAAHEEAFGLERLYDLCVAARKMLSGEHAVGRVIARPFTGRSGAYIRTANRRDFSLSPFEPTILDRVKDAGGSVTAVGKIEDIFNKAGITRSVAAHSNRESFSAALELVKNKKAPAYGGREIVFANLVDFDMLWGHRRDVQAYAKGIKEFDDMLPQLLAALKSGDALIITADHGCDPAFTRHTDHTREYVPLLVCGGGVKAGVNLGVRGSFADVAQTIADAFRLKPMRRGISFARELGIS